MKGRVFKRCQCPPIYKEGKDGKRYRVNCKKDHGSWYYVLDVPAKAGQDRRQVMKGGFPSKEEAEAALAAAVNAVNEGTFVDVDRKLNTVAAYMEDWLANKKSLKRGTRASYEQHIRNHIKPLIGHVKLKDLRAQHIERMLTVIREGDSDTKRKPVSAATTRRVFSTLRGALNTAIKKRLLAYNPCSGVELEPENNAPAQVWDAEQVRAFLAAAKDDRLFALYRLVLLRGLRRGEAVGLHWADVDLDGARLWVAWSATEVGGKVKLEEPKTEKSKRWVSLDAGTVEALRAHKKRQARHRLAWAGAYEDGDLVFPREDGTVERPHRVTRNFQRIAEGAGLPVIRLHDGRHSAASLALTAGVTMKEVQDQLGHSTGAITNDLYTHVSPAMRHASADKIAGLVDGLPGTAEGSA